MHALSKKCFPRCTKHAFQQNQQIVHFLCDVLNPHISHFFKNMQYSQIAYCVAAVAWAWGMLVGGFLFQCVLFLCLAPWLDQKNTVFLPILMMLIGWSADVPAPSGHHYVPMSTENSVEAIQGQYARDSACSSRRPKYSSSVAAACRDFRSRG